MRASILFVLRGRAANLRFSEPVSLEAHGFELAADLALLEGAGHGSHAALQAVLLAIHLLKDLPQPACTTPGLQLQIVAQIVQYRAVSEASMWEAEQLQDSNKQSSYPLVCARDDPAGWLPAAHLP